MAYNQNIPQPADQLKNSQPQLLANFQEINTLVNVNHIGFNLGDEGKHKFLQMPEQVAAPVTNASEIALFSIVGAISGVTELNFKRSGNPLTSIPFTEGLLATPGWTILPCGLVVKWGSEVINAGAYNETQSRIVVYPVVGNRPFTQPALFTLFSDKFDGNARLSPFAYSINTAVGTNTALQFNLRYSSLDKNAGATVVPITVNWLAVGI